MKRNNIVKFVMFTFVLGGFLYGFISSQYKIFPYEQIRAVKNFIHPSKNSETPGYLHRKTFFEVFGVESDVVMVGDSITFGAEWNEVFKNTSIVNRGIGGDTASGILNRIDSIISTKAKKAFVMVGINDISKGTSVDEVYSSYALIIQKLKRANITPYIQSTIYAGESLSSLNSSISSLNEKLEKLAEKEGLIFIDLNKGLSSGGLLNKKFTKDDVHLNGQGYLVWKNLINQYM